MVRDAARVKLDLHSCGPGYWHFYIESGLPEQSSELLSNLCSLGLVRPMINFFFRKLCQASSRLKSFLLITLIFQCDSLHTRRMQMLHRSSPISRSGLMFALAVRRKCQIVHFILNRVADVIKLHHNNRSMGTASPSLWVAIQSPVSFSSSFGPFLSKRLHLTGYTQYAS